MLSNRRRVTERNQNILDPRRSWPSKNHIFMLQKCRVVVDMKPVVLNGGFYDTAKVAFCGRQNNATLHNGSHVFFNQESHELWRISFSGLQKAEQRLCGCEIPVGRVSYETWVIALKVFTRSNILLSPRSLNSSEWYFQGIKMSNMAYR